MTDMNTPLLSPFYFGSVEHYRILAQHPKVIFDTGEHYERQSYRTRTSIVGPNGLQDLVVPIIRRSGVKMPMHTVGLSYVETWPQQHLHALRSAYGNTPWFIHYIDEIETIVLKKFDRLMDLDLATMRLAMKWLGLKTEVVVAEEYMEPSGQHLDLRIPFHPKKPLPPVITAVGPYPQVFDNRHDFVPRLSVIDLVMNCGPEALSYLQVEVPS